MTVDELYEKIKIMKESGLGSAEVLVGDDESTGTFKVTKDVSCLDDETVIIYK